MKTYHLDVVTLGPPFTQQTVEGFHNYVASLKEQKNIGKVAKLRVPRTKKPVLKHDLDSQNGLCRGCGKRVRNVEAKCSGPKNEKVE